MKNILAIETSSPVLSVALKTPKSSITETRLVGFLKHAENLMPMIDHLLKKNKLKIQDIDTFLIGKGPGSFTGLRIGYATLKGFLSSQKRTCYSALALDMIAENIELPEKSSLAVCLDARKDLFYLNLYERRKGAWVSKEKVRVLSLSDLIKALPNQVFFCGDSITRFGGAIEETFYKKHKTKSSKIEFLEESYWYPKASTLLKWYHNKKTKLDLLKTPEDFLPFYFRLSEAEERKRENALCH